MTDHDGPAVRPSEDAEPAAHGNPSLVVVGIGASAGGLRSLKELFATIPADSGLAFVVVVHLSPTHESHLADLLQPHSMIPVGQVTGDTRLERNQAYVIPPGRNLSVVDSHLRLAPLAEARTDRAPIDHFFRTLAQTHDGASVGVILSGSGSDGAHGIRYVRESGGMTVVLEPDEAEFDGMPRSAIATGLVDRVLPIAEMLGHIVEFARARPEVPTEDAGAKSAGKAGADSAGSEAGDPLETVLTLLRLRTGHDFHGYKRSTVGRRLARRMQILNLERLDDYVEFLRGDAPEALALLDDLLINVTSFFRDPEVFRTLETEVIPGLFEGKERGDAVRVWSVGCATGEEAYSLAMLLLEAADRRPARPQVQVFATDLHEGSLHKGREGRYTEVVEAEVSPERLERFFRRDGTGYCVTKELRDVVVFAGHNLLRDPPFSRMDLIVCRNVLIYLQRDVQDEVVEVFHYALNNGGHLLLGTAETLDRRELFRPAKKEAHLYVRHDGPRAAYRLPSLPTPAASPRRSAPAGELAPRLQHHAEQGYGAVHQRMVELYAPPSLLVTQEHDVVHFSEHVGRYLQHPGGEPTRNVFKLVREELRMELRTGVHVVRERRITWRSRPVSMRLEGGVRMVVLRVSPADVAEVEGFILVIFDVVDEAAAAAVSAGTVVTDEHVGELEAELEMTRSRMQALIEEFETSQEEMRASNEEMQSSNEELRSTMEELETSREELQSVNEELQTLNQENRHKVEELSQISSDLQNLLQATDVATVFLDRSLRILRYTPRASDIFNVRQSDRGRPLADITHRLGNAELMEDARRVLQTLVPVEREVQARDGDASYVLRVTPYRTMDDRIEGVVITLVDVSALKQTEAALRTSEEKFRSLFDSMDEAYAVVEVLSDEAGAWNDFLFLDANPAFVKHTGMEYPVGRTATQLVGASAPRWAGLYGRVVETGESLRTEQEEPTLGRIFDLNVFLLGEPGSRRVAVLFTDVTERRVMEQALRDLNDTLERRVEERTREVRDSEERLRTLVETAALTVWSADHAGRMVEDSPSWRAFTGQTREERMGEGWADVVHPDDRPTAVGNWADSVAAQAPVNAEFRLWHAPSRSWRWTNVRAAPLRAAEGAVRGWIGMNIDVDARKRAEAHRSEALRRLITAEEAERQRLSRELHDSLGQLVTGLLLGLKSLRPGPDQVARIDDLAGLADRVAREMQNMAVELRPPALDSLGLAPAVQNHLEEWSQRFGIECDFHASGVDGERFPPEVEATAYRVLQEGLTNVLKHAAATRVSVLLERGRGTLNAILEDDGCGFDVEATQADPAKAARLGLRGMTERVSLLGGEMQVESEPGSGTTLYVRLPIPSEAGPEEATDA